MIYERVSLMKDLLAEDGSIYVHCDWRVSGYLRLVLDEIFSEEYFLNEIIWCYKEREMTVDKWNKKHDNIFYYAKNNTNNIFNSNDVLDPYTEVTAEKFKNKNEIKYYHIRGKGKTANSDHKEN